MARTGRPRSRGPSRSGLSTEQDILRAAGRLFCDAGYAGTSTHRIADEAGLSQASLYHYFSGKHAVLLALLLDTVEPSLQYAATLAADASHEEPADARLWALCSYDVGLLLSGEDNLGALYLLPELADDRFAGFHARRSTLYGHYRALTAAVLETDEDDAHARASVVFGLVESVILRRRTEPGLTGGPVATLVADSALRVLGVDHDRIRTVRTHAARLLPLAQDTS